MATYRSIEFAFAIHGHEESASNTKYAHHSSFHGGDFQQTYRGDTGIRGTEGCALTECVVSVLRSPKGSHPQRGVDPHAPALLWVASEPQPRAAPRPMPSLLLAKYLFLLRPQASFCVAEVKISQSVLGANETFVIMQLISPPLPPRILLFQLDIRVMGPRG